MGAKNAKEVGERIITALEDIPANDRIGFLYGLVLGMLQDQGFNKEDCRKELEFGLDIAYKHEL